MLWINKHPIAMFSDVYREKNTYDSCLNYWKACCIWHQSYKTDYIWRQIHKHEQREKRRHFNIFDELGVKLDANIERIPSSLITSPAGAAPRDRSLRFVVCPCRADWAARDWRPAGVLSNQRSAPRPMGESSLLLAKASVGKNAERDSHEPGARKPSINNAAACVGGRGWQSCSVRFGGRWQLSDNATRTDWWDFRPYFHVLWLNVNFLWNVCRCFKPLFSPLLLPKRIYFLKLC